MDRDLILAARFLECDESLWLDDAEADRIAAKLRRLAELVSIILGEEKDDG